MRSTVLAALLLLTGQVFGQPDFLLPIGGEFQVNSYTIGPQRYPDVSIGPQGEFIVVWESGDINGSGPDGSETSVQAQRYAPDGSPLSGEFQVNSYTTGRQRTASTTSLSDGNFLVVWRSDPGSQTSVQAQILSEQGVPIGAEFPISTDANFGTAISASPSGEFVALWQNTGVRGQRFNSTGITIGDELLITETGGGAVVSHDHLGNFLVAWGESIDVPEHQFGTNSVLKGRRFDAAGDPITQEFQVSVEDSYGKGVAGTTIQPNGDFVVLWAEETVDDAITSVKARQFFSNTLPMGDAFLVGETTLLSAPRPQIASLESGDYLIAWNKEFPLEIYARYYLADGTPVGEEFNVNTYQFGIKTTPRIDVGDHNDLVIVWGSSNQDGHGASVHGQRYGLDSDVDGELDLFDNCPDDFNPDQSDDDGDGVGNLCDLCPGFDDTQDADGDSVPDDCDICEGDDASGDSDGDGICNDLDICYGDNSSGDADSDGYCADVDCDDSDPTNTSPACTIFADGFETGDTSLWSSTEP